MSDREWGIGHAGWFVLVCASLLILVTGCFDARRERPPVSDSTMVDLLIELHLAVARVEVTHSVPPDIQDSIFTAYGVDSSAFAETISYYAADPEKYGRIYGQVLDKLNSERVPLAPEGVVDPTLEVESRRVPYRDVGSSAR